MKILIGLLLVLSFSIGFTVSNQMMKAENQYYLESNVELLEISKGWQYAAEYYGGICKWFLSDKPIYGTIEMGDNSVLRDCLIISGSSEASIIVEGPNALIQNNIFKVIDMDWVSLLTEIDPNTKIGNVVINPGSAVCYRNFVVIDN